VFRICFAAGTVFTILVNIALGDEPGWIFLTVVMVIQLVATGLSSQLMDLKDDNKKSVLTKEESEKAKLVS